MNEEITVYIIVNTESGRKYIGRSRIPMWRFEQHKSLLRNGKHSSELMQEDYSTFGPDSFEFVEYGSYEDDEAARMEVFLMKMLRTQDKRFGYNYKDRSGICKNAIKDRWRTPPRAWQPIFRRKYLEGKTRWRVNRLPYHEPEPIPKSVCW